MPTSYVVMGVSGSGKSTVGAALAKELAVGFVDGDDLHPAANKAKMAAGVALTDEDRAPWLAAIGVVLTNGHVVVACSALKRSYRDYLRTVATDFQLIYLRGDRTILSTRLAGRDHEYMPASLLESQLQTLEEPGADERPFSFDIALAPAEIVEAVLRRAQS
ncbi:MAG: gluconokinase [Actinomycetota bacterium]|nr:gluconokinase [Actinomycetota bacterium]